MSEKREARAILPTVELKASAGPISVQITSRLWPRWLRVAIGQEHEAHLARRRARASQERQGDDFSSAISDELDSSLVAIASAAFAVDAFYGAVKRTMTVAPKSGGRTARAKQIIATLNGKQGFAIGPSVKMWTSELTWLFRLRDRAVHFDEEPQDTKTHPLGFATAPEHSDYSVETTKRALDLVLEILQACIDNPKPANKVLIAHVNGLSGSLAKLTERRANLMQSLNQDGDKSNSTT